MLRVRELGQGHKADKGGTLPLITSLLLHTPCQNPTVRSLSVLFPDNPVQVRAPSRLPVLLPLGEPWQPWQLYPFLVIAPHTAQSSPVKCAPSKMISSGLEHKACIQNVIGTHASQEGTCF